MEPKRNRGKIINIPIRSKREWNYKHVGSFIENPEPFTESILLTGGHTSTFYAYENEKIYISINAFPTFINFITKSVPYT